MGTTICGSSSRGVFMMASAPSSSAATMVTGVNLERMKPAAIFPPAAAWASLHLNPLAGKFAACGIGNDSFACRQPGKNFHAISCSRTQADVAERGQIAITDYVNVLQLPPINHRRTRHRDGLLFSAAEIRAAKKSGAQCRIVGNIKLHHETATRRIGSGDNLCHFGPQRPTVEGIKDYRHALTLVDKLQVTLVYGDLKAVMAGLFHGQQRHAGSSQRARIHAPLRYHAIKRRQDRGIAE